MSIESALVDVRKVASLIEPMVAVIAVAEAATHVGGPTAEVAVQAIAAAVKSLAHLVEGTTTHDQAMASLKATLAALASKDAQADAALAARFPQP